MIQASTLSPAISLLWRLIEKWLRATIQQKLLEKSRPYAGPNGCTSFFCRAALSRLFPRYGRYCGPNYSSGRDDGSKTWDQAPVDWLDNCCYRHDLAYDSHDQTVLLQVTGPRFLPLLNFLFLVRCSADVLKKRRIPSLQASREQDCPFSCRQATIWRCSFPLGLSRPGAVLQFSSPAEFYCYRGKALIDFSSNTISSALPTCLLPCFHTTTESLFGSSLHFSINSTVRPV